MPDENCRTLVDYIPFIGLAIGKSTMSAPLITRLTETIVMSMVAGGFAMYVAVETIKTELNQLKLMLHKVEQKVDSVDVKVEKVRSDLYVPLGKGGMR